MTVNDIEFSSWSDDGRNGPLFEIPLNLPGALQVAFEALSLCGHRQHADRALGWPERLKRGSLTHEPAGLARVAGGDLKGENSSDTCLPRHVQISLFMSVRRRQL
jgi:hypothetical protein